MTLNREDLNKVITIANNMFVNEAIPRELSSQELQAYFICKAMMTMLDNKNVTVDRNSFFREREIVESVMEMPDSNPEFDPISGKNR